MGESWGGGWRRAARANNDGCLQDVSRPVPQRGARKRIVRAKPEPLTVPETINQCWSMDFMYDQLSDGQSYRLFNVIDDFNWEALAIGIDWSLPSEWVMRSLNQIIEWRGKPLVIRSNNGPEYISGIFITSPLLPESSRV